MDINKKIVFILLLFFSFLSFGLTFKAGFIWDDHQMIVDNPNIKSFSFENIKHNFFSNAFNRPEAYYYRPLQIISYMFDFKLFKLDPLGWHLVNFLFHFLNSFFLFLLLRKLNIKDEISFFASLFFAVNPIVVEQMIIIAGRAELMTLTFSLLSLLFYLEGGKFYFILSLIFYIFSMLSKESGIVTPLLLILCLWFKEKKEFDNKIIFYFILMPFYLALRKAAVNPPSLNMNLFDLFTVLLLKLPFVFLNYLYKTIIPFNLHSHNVVDYFNIFWYLILILGIIILIYFVFVKSKNKIYIFSLLLYFIFMLPKFPLFAVQSLVLDHWIYPSNIGLFLFLSYILDKFKEKYIKISNLIIIILLSIWIYFSVDNIPKRDNDIKIYQNAIRYKTSSHVYYNLSREYYLRGDYVSARRIMEIVIKDYLKDEMFLNAYAMVLNRTGEKDKAIDILADIIKTGAKMSVTYTNLAGIFAEEKEFDKALKYLEMAFTKFPEDENIKLYIARIFALKGNKDRAIILLREILKFNPYNPEALLNLAIFEFEKGKYKESKEYFNRLYKINPNHPIVLKYLNKLEIY